MTAIQVRGPRNYRVREGCTVHFARIATGEVYGWVSVKGGVQYGKARLTSRSFINASTFEKQYLEATEWQRKAQGWPHAPKSWLVVPPIDKILKQCKVIEVPHRNREDIMEFEIHS